MATELEEIDRSGTDGRDRNGRSANSGEAYRVLGMIRSELEFASDDGNCWMTSTT